MTTTNPNVRQDYENLNKTFDIDPIKYEVNEDLLFNTDLLNRCREDCKHTIDLKLATYGGSMVSDVLELIDIRTVHPAGKEIRNNDTNEVLPKGFQIRANVNIDIGHKNELLEYIWDRDWLTTAPAMVFFRLPEYYQYVRADGIKVIWGIADGSHRFDAASDANETSVIGWKVDFKISNPTTLLSTIRKFANAELNLSKYVKKSRTEEDVAASVIETYRDKPSDLYAKIQNAKEEEITQIYIDEIMTYHYKSQKARAIYKILQNDKDIVVARKEYQSDLIESYIAEHCIDGVSSKNPYCQYVTNKGVRVIVTQTSGEKHLTVAYKICKLVQESDAPIAIAFATSEKGLNKNNAYERRQQFRRKVFDTIKDMGQGSKMIFEDLTAVNPKWLCFPELADEFDDGLINLV